MKNSASWAGRRLERGHDDERRAPVVQQAVVTASARSTKPGPIVWKRMKNSAMSWRNCVPEDPVGDLVEGLDVARFTRRLLYGHRQQRSRRLEKKSAIRSGASRKSRALRVGGVSTTIRS